MREYSFYEPSKDTREHIADSAKDVMLGRMYRRAFEKLETDGFPGFAQASKEALDNVRINLIEASGPHSQESLEELHQHLNTESGMLIANHPGGGESLAISSILKRDDVLFMVAEDMKKFDYSIAKKYFITTGSTPKEILEHLTQGLKHIEQGGLFVLFPAGGGEYKGDSKFRSGFRYMLENIRQDKMVYSIFIQPEDAQKIHSAGKFSTAQRFASLGFPRLAELGAYEQNNMHMLEQHSRAIEWKNIIENEKNKVRQTELLTKHFYNQFNREP